MLHFVHSFIVDGHLVYFHFSAIMNNAAVNIFLQLIVQTNFHFSIYMYILWMEFLGQMVTLCLAFWGTVRLFFRVAEPLHISISSSCRLQFHHILTNTCYFLSVWLESSLLAWSGISLWFGFAKWSWSSSCTLTGHLYIFFREISI